MADSTVPVFLYGDRLQVPSASYLQLNKCRQLAFFLCLFLFILTLQFLLSISVTEEGMIEGINLSPFSLKVLPLFRISGNETHHLSACSLRVRQSHEKHLCVFEGDLNVVCVRNAWQRERRYEEVCCELREKVCLHMFMCACGTFSVHSRHCENQTISCSEQKGK